MINIKQRKDGFNYKWQVIPHFDDDLIKFNMKSNAVLAIIATFAMKPFSTFFTKINMTSDL